MPHRQDFRPSAARLREFADALESEGDDLLAAAARRAAVEIDAEIDAAPPSGSPPPRDTPDDEAGRVGDART